MMQKQSPASRDKHERDDRRLGAQEAPTRFGRELSELLDYSELSRITRKSVVTLRRYKMLGIGPRHIQIGRNVRFRREDVIEWLESLAGETQILRHSPAGTGRLSSRNNSV
jgi:predicted DNA-binding transcriptional regulator AlpA